MSDATATPAAAPAAQPATPAGQPTSGSPTTTTPPAAGVASATPAPKGDVRSQIDALLKEAGGYKIKVGGKENRIESLEQWERVTQRGWPIEESLKELAKEKAALAPKAKLLEQLQSDDEEEVERAVSELLGDKLDRLSERRVMRQIQRDESLKDYTPRERELAQALEAERAERQRMAKESQAKAAAEAKRVEAAKTREYMDSMANHATAALKLLDLPEKLEGVALNIMSPVLSAAIDSGVSIAPEVLAQKVDGVLSQILAWSMKSKGPAGLQKLFGSDFDKMYRKQLLATLNPTNGTQPPAPQQTNSTNESVVPAGGFHRRTQW